MPSPYKIGVDGGGSKTEFILTDAAGKILARRLAPGCNPSLTDHATVRALMTENLAALRAASRQLDPQAQLSHTLLCMAGRPDFWREFAAQLADGGRVETCVDSIPVLELATDGRPGLALHSGTGSFVAARGPDGATHYAGGLGWRFGDPGSAYDLGRRAIARTILELQGWSPPSALGAAIRQAAGFDQAATLTRHFYTAETPNAAISAFAPQVTALAAAGDETALALLRASVGELAQLARTVLDRLFVAPAGIQNSPVPAGLSGAILQTPAAGAVLTAALGDRCELRSVTAAPIEGVRRLLARL
ncbi:MAG: N-acetylglucosamine kinase [Opitutales bacterium]